MRYFNGFSLKGEEKYFSELLTDTPTTVAGFSYGAQKALEYVLHTDRRIDRLILLSPAFFQTSKRSFIRTQLRYYEADKDAYTTQFLLNVASPSKMDLLPSLSNGTVEELENLLTYVWDDKKIRLIREKGTVIEIFLGEEDKIIDIDAAYDFFSVLTTTYLIKKAGHLLAV